MLLVGLLRSRLRAPPRGAVPRAADARRSPPGSASGSGASNTEIVERALAIDDLTLSLTMVFCGGGIAAVLLSWRSRAVVEAGEGEYYALLLSSILGMVVLVAAQNLVALFLGFELLSIPLYVLCATHMRREHVAGVGPEVPDHRLGRLGDAALRPGVPLRRDGHDRLRGHRRGGDLRTCCSTPASRWWSRAWPSRRRWRPSTSGRPTSTRARRPPSPAFMAVATKAAAFGVMLRLFDVALIDVGADVGPGAGRAGADHDRGRQRGRDRAVVAEADARLLVDRAGRLHAGRRRWSRRGSACRRRSST